MKFMLLNLNWIQSTYNGMGLVIFFILNKKGQKFLPLYLLINSTHYFVCIAQSIYTSITATTALYQQLKQIHI